MKKGLRNIIWTLVFVLLFGSIAGCSREDLKKILQENGRLQRSEEREQVQDEPSRQRAEVPQIEQKEVKPIQKISGEKYAYGQLDALGQTVYDEMLSTILNHEDKISLSTTDTEVMNRAYAAVCSDYGGLFWVNGYVFTRYKKGDQLVGLEFSPKYTMTQEVRRQTQQMIDRVVEEWFAGISINEDGICGGCQRQPEYYQRIFKETDRMSGLRLCRSVSAGAAGRPEHDRVRKGVRAAPCMESALPGWRILLYGRNLGE